MLSLADHSEIYAPDPIPCEGSVVDPIPGARHRKHGCLRQGQSGYDTGHQHAGTGVDVRLWSLSLEDAYWAVRRDERLPVRLSPPDSPVEMHEQLSKSWRMSQHRS